MHDLFKSFMKSQRVQGRVSLFQTNSGCVVEIKVFPPTSAPYIREVEHSSKVEARPMVEAVSRSLIKFNYLMSGKLPKGLPPRRAINHKIELLSGIKPPTKASYRMSPKEMVEVRKQLSELLGARKIQPSKVQFSALVWFQGKHDKSMRMWIIAE